MTKTTENNTVDTSPLMSCYGIFGFSIILMGLQVKILSAAGMLGMIVVAIWAYRLRKRDNPLFHNHGRWLVRSFWLSSLYMFVAMQISGFIVSANADNTAIEALPEALKEGSKTPDEIAAMILEYNATNYDLILYTTLACFVPVATLLLWRIVKGYRMADAGQPIENVKSWLV